MSNFKLFEILPYF